MPSSLTPRRLAIIVLAAVTLIGGLAFMFTGRAAELGQWRDVTVTVVVSNVPPAVAEAVEPGAPIYTDPAAMDAGRIDEVTVGPMYMVNPDSSGTVQVSENPLMREVTVVFTTKGRQTAELIATGNQVIQVGQQFSVITSAVLLRGTVTRIDVR